MAYTPTPDDNSSITVYVRTPWRGGTRNWSTRLHLTGPKTITDAHWATLRDLVCADLADCLRGDQHINRATWSDATDATSTNLHGDATKDSAVSFDGQLSITGHQRAVPEAATYCRFATTQRSVKNKPIYLFTWLHGMLIDTGSPEDQLAAAQKTAVEEFGADQLAGWADGADTRVRCGPHGAVAQSVTVPTYLHHRDFPS
jgi:hypothetical protein